jgi:hypothetical protein
LEQLIKRDGFVVGRHFLFADVIDGAGVRSSSETVSGGLRPRPGKSLLRVAPQLAAERQDWTLWLWEFQDSALASFMRPLRQYAVLPR